MDAKQDILVHPCPLGSKKMCHVVPQSADFAVAHLSVLLYALNIHDDA